MLYNVYKEGGAKKKQIEQKGGQKPKRKEEKKMNIREILKNKRIELGLSQYDVAKETTISQARLSRFECGYHTNNVESVISELKKYYKMREPQEPKKAVKRAKKKTTKKDNVDFLEKDTISRLEKVAQEEIAKNYKKILKKTLKRFIKEL